MEIFDENVFIVNTIISDGITIRYREFLISAIQYFIDSFSYLIPSIGIGYDFRVINLQEQYPLIIFVILGNE